MDPTQLRSFFALLRRRWLLVVQGVVVVAAAMAIFTALSPAPQARATTQVDAKVIEGVDPGFYIQNPQVFIDSQTEMVYSAKVYRSAVAKLTEATDKAALGNGLKVRGDEKTLTLFISHSADTPEQAVRLTNAIADGYVDVRLAQQDSGVQSGIDGLGEQIAKVEPQLRTAEKNLATASANRDTLVFNRQQYISQGNATKVAEVNAQLTDVQADVSTYTSQRDSLQNQYNSLLTQQQTLRTQLNLEAPAAAVSERASAGARPPATSPVKRGLMGAGIGLVVGIGLAIAWDLFDDRVRTRAEVEAITQRPILSQLPIERELESARSMVPVVDRPSSQLAEAVRGLRTTLTFLAADRPLGMVAVTSAASGDGKSMVSADLAAAYAQLGASVLLVSGDLRRPSLDIDIFNVAPGTAGLSELIYRPLSGPGELMTRAAHMSLDVEDVLIGTRIPNLRFLPTGALPVNPSELLASPMAAEVFKKLRSTADIVIVDCPPTLVADAMLLASLADGVLVVASMNATRRAAFGAAMEDLTRARIHVLGLVLNRVRKGNSPYGYYGTYGTESR